MGISTKSVPFFSDDIVIGEVFEASTADLIHNASGKTLREVAGNVPMSLTEADDGTMTLKWGNDFVTWEVKK